MTTTAEIECFLEAEIEEHRQTLALTATSVAQSFEAVLQIFERCIRGGGKVLLFGNGGSAADAQHIAAELVIRYKADRAAIAAIALTTDTSALTACGNDLGFDQIFARQVEALARPGDAVVGISTSGRSPNVIAGLQMARKCRALTVGLSGGDGGEMPALCDTCIVIPSRITARIQEMHMLVGHMLCKALERRLGLVQGS
jgi:D-sedoheptulose 7-phosphate isomerase